MENRSERLSKGAGFEEQLKEIEQVLATPPRGQTLVGVYRARTSGNATVLTAPRAHPGQNYALFTMGCGMLLYVPITDKPGE